MGVLYVSAGIFSNFLLIKLVYEYLIIQNAKSFVLVEDRYRFEIKIKNNY